ncbi:MAG: DUF4091 domain-containing protein [Armatimonadetes bacterium]|nr:DUF4091 domain-containing protein [Armatimonadota bacterium]
MRRDWLILAAMMTASAAFAQGGLLPNGSFERGADAPEGWTLSAPPGEWSAQGVTGRCVTVIGDGKTSNYWMTDRVQFEPGRTYEVSCRMRTDPGSAGGALITGPNFANYDYRSSEEWVQRKFVFRMPDEVSDPYVRFGQWHFNGTVFYDDAAVRPAQPINRVFGDIELGHGEAIDGDRYLFNSKMGGYNADYSRVLERVTAHLNTHRWVFFPGAEVIYRHHIPGAQHVAAAVTVKVGYHSRGSCIVQAGTDGRTWVELGTIDQVAERRFDVPAELLPAAEIYVRLGSPGEGERGDSEPGSFQVYGYSFESTLDRELGSMQGDTSFLVVTQTDDRLAVEVQSLGGLLPGRDNVVRMTLNNPGDAAVNVTARVELQPEEGAPVVFERAATVPAGGRTQVEIPYLAERIGPWSGVVRVVSGDRPLFAGEFVFSVPELFRAGFGYAIDSDPVMDLWWCEGAYKVNRDRPAPKVEGRIVKLEAARGEYEPVQIVLRPKRKLTRLTASASELLGPGGARISADDIEVLRVGYVKVWRPTDFEGCEGWWPDPLPPLDAPVDLAANRNQPLWLRVFVPRDARPGRYTGKISLRADGWSADVPVSLRVFDFEVPDRHSMVATMGFSAGALKRYHHLQTDEQLREVFDLYMRSFRAHRIDPYSPFALGSIHTRVVGAAWNGGAVVKDNPASGAHCLKVEDTSETGNISADQVELIPIDRSKSYVLRFKARTATDGQVFMTTLGSHGADGRWMSGQNRDVRYTGSTQWQEFEKRYPAGSMAEGCHSVHLTLRATNWRESGEDTGTTWFDDIFFGEDAEGAENLVSDPGFEGDADAVRVQVDFTDFDREMEHYIDEFGFQSFRLPIGYMPRRDAPGHVGPFEQGSEGYDRVVGEYLHELQEHLREKGWLDEAYAYWVDEPAPEHYANVRYGMRLLDEYAPDIRRMLTEQPEPDLVGFVDIWCPVLHNYDEEKCHARQAAGDRIWWYVCTGPKAPYAGLFIDHNALDLRVWQWMTHKYDVQGCLIWATNYWYSPARTRETGSYQNPWDDPMSYTSSGGGYWGNGDGRFMYPPNVDPNSEREPVVCGPVDSIRWEMLREGLEDYEYFALLRRLLEKKPDAAAARLLTIPKTILVDPKDFNRDPQPLYAHRRAVAEAIERVGR